MYSFRAAHILGALSSTLFCVAMPAAMAQSSGVTSDKIVLHHVGPFTNSGLAASNKEALDAANLYFDRVNKAGGVNGRKIIVETSDDNQDPKKSAALTKEIIDKGSAVAFLMPRTSPTIEAMIPLVEAARIPMIAPQPGPDIATTPPKRYVFAVRASYDAEIAAAVKLQNSFSLTKFAIIGAKGPFGDSAAKALQTAVAALSLKPAQVIRVDDRAPVITEAVTTFSESKPEVVFLACTAKCASDFAKAFSATGNRAQYIALSNSSNALFVKELGDSGSGVMVMQVVPSPFSPKVSASREYRAAAEAAKLPVTYTGMQSWLAAKLVVEGLKRAGKTPTPESLTVALEGMRNVDLGDFVVNFSPTNRMGSKFVEPTMINKAGRFVY
jgi:branched-chain amino acid transport system substrate-binding protein